MSGQLNKILIFNYPLHALEVCNGNFQTPCILYCDTLQSAGILIQGTTAGYVKIWLMKNYMLPWQVKVVMPIYRLQFPFMWKDRIEGRAKRVVREQPLPILLSSYRAHLKAITSIEYIPSCKIVVR